MPLWLLRLLPYGLAALALGLAIGFIDHQGYERAQSQNKIIQTQEALTRAEMKLELITQISDFEKKMQSMVDVSDLALSEKVDQIDTVNKTIIQPTLVKEIQSEARLSDPNLGVTDGMLQSINQARALSSDPCASYADSRACKTVPIGEPRP